MDVPITLLHPYLRGWWTFVICIVWDCAVICWHVSYSLFMVVTRFVILHMLMRNLLYQMLPELEFSSLTSTEPWWLWWIDNPTIQSSGYLRMLCIWTKKPKRRSLVSWRYTIYGWSAAYTLCYVVNWLYTSCCVCPWIWTFTIICRQIVSCLHLFSKTVATICTLSRKCKIKDEGVIHIYSANRWSWMREYSQLKAGPDISGETSLACFGKQHSRVGF